MQTLSDDQFLCWADPVHQDINLNFQDINLSLVGQARTTVQLNRGWDGLSRLRRRQQRPCQGARWKVGGGKARSGRGTRLF